MNDVKEKRPVGRPRKTVAEIGQEIVNKVQSVGKSKENAEKIEALPKGVMIHKGIRIVFDDEADKRHESSLGTKGIPLGTVMAPAGSSTEYIIVYRNKHIILIYGKEFTNSGGPNQAERLIANFRYKSWVPKTNVEQIKDAIKKYSNLILCTQMKYDSSNVPVAILRYPEGGQVMIGVGVTGNCQLVVIGYMDYLLATSTDPVKQIIEIARFGGRRMVMCDVKNDTNIKLKKLFGERVVVSSNYTSSNGSQMYAVVINVKGMY